MITETLEVIPIRGVEEGIEEGVSIYYKLGRCGVIVDCGLHPEEKITDEELISIYRKLNRHFDFMLLTHPHNDHIRKALLVAGYFHIPICCTSVCKRYLKIHAKRDDINFDAIKINVIKEGDEFNLDGATVRVVQWKHSTPHALGFDIYIGDWHLLHMGDGKLNGIFADSYKDNVDMFREIAKKPVHLLTLDALKADRGGVVPPEIPMIENIAKIALENPGKKIFIFMFATHLDKIQAIIKQILDCVYSNDEKYSKIRESGIRFLFRGNAMKNAADIIAQENEVRNLVKNLNRADAGTSIIFGTTGGEFSYDKLLVRKDGFLRDRIEPGDVVIFSSGLIPSSNEEEFKQTKKETEKMVREMFLSGAQIYTTKWFAKDVGVQECVTVGHFNIGGHEKRKGLQKVLEILNPEMILPFHLLKGGGAALQRLAGDKTIVFQPSHLECMKLGAIETPKKGEK